MVLLLVAILNFPYRSLINLQNYNNFRFLRKIVTFFSTEIEIRRNAKFAINQMVLHKVEILNFPYRSLINLQNYTCHTSMTLFERILYVVFSRKILMIILILFSTETEMRRNAERTLKQLTQIQNYLKSHINDLFCLIALF